MDEKPDATGEIRANPYVGGKTGPSTDAPFPGEIPVAGPEEYRDPWNPRFARLNRLRRVVRRWIGGGG